MSTNLSDEIIEKAVGLALEEYDKKTRGVIFGCEYKGEAQAISDLVDKYVAELLKEQSENNLPKVA